MPGIVAFTGHRALPPGARERIAAGLAEVLSRSPVELRFGGAPGADTVALELAAAARGPGTAITVLAPSTARDLPATARRAALAHADRIVELGFPFGARWSYLRRNDALLDGADLLLAFWDGRERGGTWYTVARARRLGVPVLVIPA